LLAALQEAESQTDVPCIPVAFHSQGFRIAAPVPERASAQMRPVARMYRWLTGGRLRELAQSCLPLILLEAAWAFANRVTFDALSADEEPIAFGPGDLLVLADESWNYRAWKAAALARSRGAMAVLVLYDLIPLRQPEYCAPLFTRVFPSWLLQTTAHCDVVMCISRATALDFHRFCGESHLAQPKTSHFRLGCDVFPVGPAGAVRSRIAEFADRPGAWFSAVGTIEPRKNYPLLLRVFEHLWVNGRDIRLLITGRPHPACSGLITQLLQHPEQGRRLLTVLDASDGEVSLVYSRCRALLFPTLAEGFGLPLVEARAMGCTVIASSLPALLELADDGVLFFSPDSADELEALIIEQASLPNRGLPVSPKVFTWRQSANQFLAQIHEVLSEDAH
jgi:glycosyltransferase involved in cell wall biosynthesis